MKKIAIRELKYGGRLKTFELSATSFGLSYHICILRVSSQRVRYAFLTTTHLILLKENSSDNMFVNGSMLYATGPYALRDVDREQYKANTVQVITKFFARHLSFI